MRRYRISKWINECEVAPERPVFGREYYLHIPLGKMRVQFVSVVTTKPDCNARSELYRLIKVLDRRANGEWNRVGFENNRAGRSFRRGRKPDDIPIEGECGVQILRLDADEIRSN